MLFKEIVDGRTHGRTTDAGHWRITKAHLSTSCSGELKKSPILSQSNIKHINNIAAENMPKQEMYPENIALQSSPSKEGNHAGGRIGL